MNPLIGDATTTIWTIALLHVVTSVVLSALFFIFRDAMEDDANWLEKRVSGHRAMHPL